MAITGGVSESYKKSFHTRNDLGELDVFEAANYFSGYNNEISDNSSSQYNNHHERSSGRVSRISLDVPLMRRNSSLLLPPHQQINNNNNKLEKKFKQPSSPGGRFANFLNSLFNQTSSKKNKKSKSDIKDRHEEEDLNPTLATGWRRKRRSSISHFQSSNTNNTGALTLNDQTLNLTNSKSGFRTPPTVAAFTSTKSTYKDLRSFSSLKKSSTDNYNKKINTNNKDLSWLSEKLKEEFDNGAESDSSSDLFELHDFSSSGLPVYETTQMENIKRSGAVLPISINAV